MAEQIDWSKLGFGYSKAPYNVRCTYKDGAWGELRVCESEEVTMHMAATVLHYGQAGFEGLKAYTTADGKIVTFRPDLNADRMKDSCQRLEMPVFPKDRFIQAVLDTVKANIDYVPPYGSGATLYIRPYMFGSSSVIGVKPADEYQFRILVTPVGPYFKGGVKPITVRLSDLDRAAPHGTGDIKAGLNYAMSLHNIVDAHKQGFAENMYTDPATHTYIEETGGANILFVTKDGNLFIYGVDRPVSRPVLGGVHHMAKIHSYSERYDISAFGECGTLYGVYYFLRECLGVRWFAPGELGEVCPKTRNVTLPDLQPAGDRCRGLTFVITGDVHHYKNRNELKA